MSMHSTEIGGSQMAVELVYDLLTRNDDEAKRILDNVIAIMIPSFNPDGEVMVTEWYRKTVGTDAEGTSPPWLYQKYAGHDNNRDAFQQNLPDSKYISKLLFREWIPQAYVDHHHMGSNGARIYLPPYAEPVRPSADPIVWRELAWYGAHMATKEEEYSMSGVINDAVYSGWGHMGFHWITPFHNIAGMLTESASARLASPLTLTKEQLTGNTRNLHDVQGADQLPEPVAGRRLASARHRRSPEDLGVGDARSRGAKQGDGAAQHVPQRQAPDRARRERHAKGVHRLARQRPARSAHRAEDDPEAARTRASR